MAVEDFYELAKSLGLTLRQIEEETGVSHSVVHTILTGKGHSFYGPEKKEKVLAYIRAQALLRKATIDSMLKNGPKPNQQ